MRLCSIQDCSGTIEGRGWCQKHYARWRRHGDPLKVPSTSYEKKFNDSNLDELHRSDPYREFTLDEIAKALGTKRQTVWAIEQRALRKLRVEFIKRGLV